MSKHDDFWRNQATEEDYADLNIPTAPQVKYLVDAIKPAVFHDNGSILEFGCGYGRLTREVKKAFPKSFVSGIDINPDILKKAEEYSGWDKAKKDPFKFPFYYCKDHLAPDMPKQNAIYSVQVLQHMPNDRKRQFFNEAAAVLKRAGVLVFQYVEGTEDTFLTHGATEAQITEWLWDAEFEIANIEHNLIQDRWTWVTAVRR